MIAGNRKTKHVLQTQTGFHYKTLQFRQGKDSAQDSRKFLRKTQKNVRKYLEFRARWLLRLLNTNIDLKFKKIYKMPHSSANAF